MIGDRPAGETSIESSLAQTVAGSIKAFGLKPNYSIQSTDSNIPISRNIPALTLGTGDNGGRGHSLDEWTDVEKESSVRAAKVMLTVLLSAAGGR